eukprot:gene493-929_t
MNLKTDYLSISHTNTIISVVVFVCSLLYFIQHLRKWHSHKAIRKPNDCSWIDQRSYDVLIDVCDTFFPSILTTSGNLLVECLHTFHSQLISNNIVDVNDLMTKKEFYNRCAGDIHTAMEISQIVQKNLSQSDSGKLKILLQLLSTSFGCFLLTGYPFPFTCLTLQQRSNALKRLRDSFLPDLRVAFQVFRRLASCMFISAVDDNNMNPSWKDMKLITNEIKKKALHNDIKHSSKSHKRMNTILPTREDPSQPLELIADVIVVGSGAGGGIVASQLARCNLKVILIEKGGYYRAEDFRSDAWHEKTGLSTLFERGGLMSTEDGSVTVLAGSCLGGGTTVNWSASVRTPDNIRREWASLGLPLFEDGGDFESSLDTVHKLLHVNSKYSHRFKAANTTTNVTDTDSEFIVNDCHHHLVTGGERAGFRVEAVPRNVRGCVDCGACPLGCPFEAKQSTLTAVIEPLGRSGVNVDKDGNRLLRVITYADVRKVLIENNRAVGVQGLISQIQDNEGHGRQLTEPLPFKVTAKIVVCSAGAINTPALLLRSGLKHPKIGKHLSLHPTVPCMAIFPKTKMETGLGRGVPLGVVIYPPANKEYKKVSSLRVKVSRLKEGEAAIEPVPCTAGLWASVCPYSDPITLRTLLLLYSQSSLSVALIHDTSQESNCVRIDATSGDAILNYSFTKSDEDLLLRSLCEQFRIHNESGALAIFSASEDFPWYFPIHHGSDNQSPSTSLSSSSSSIEVEKQEHLEKYLEALYHRGNPRGKMQVFSAHQMGTCRMSVDPQKGPVRSTGELWETDSLYVADASLFPSSIGINPMITIAALGITVAKQVAIRLGREEEWDAMSYDDKNGSSPDFSW